MRSAMFIVLEYGGMLGLDIVVNLSPRLIIIPGKDFGVSKAMYG